ncbi:hypothetical protein SEA_BUMBLE_77 [Arthrobacter phage Bumble]
MIDGITGWVSHLTKHTASVRMNFPVEATDEEILEPLFVWLGEELREVGRGDEAARELWALKDDRIAREYPSAGKSSARIRLRRVR